MKKMFTQVMFICLLATMTTQVLGQNYTMTFDTTPVKVQDAYGPGQVYIEGDYSISVGANGSLIRFDPYGNSFSPNNGTIYMGGTYLSQPRLQRVDGNVFNLIGLDIAPYNILDPWTHVSLTGYLQDGSSVNASFRLSSNVPFNTQYLNWNGLKYVDIANGFAMDNIQVSTIPEPATLLLLGLGATIAARRQRY
jgi:hypothetical protein